MNVSIRPGRIVVIGGDSGIGLAIAEKLLTESAEVLICGRNEDKLKNAQDRLGSDHIHSMVWDVTDFEMIPARVLDCRSALGGWFDGFVCSQGAFNSISTNATEEEFDSMMNVNSKSVYFLHQEIVRYFDENHIKGNICTISSCVGDERYPTYGIYELSKRTVTQIVRMFGVKYAKEGIVINGVAPGVVRTPMSPVGGSQNVSGEVSQPEDIADVALFLLSRQGVQICGETVLVNAIMK